MLENICWSSFFSLDASSIMCMLQQVFAGTPYAWPRPPRVHTLLTPLLCESDFHFDIKPDVDPHVLVMGLPLSSTNALRLMLMSNFQCTFGEGLFKRDKDDSNKFIKPNHSGWLSCNDWLRLTSYKPSYWEVMLAICTSQAVKVLCTLFCFSNRRGRIIFRNIPACFIWSAMQEKSQCIINAHLHKCLYDFRMLFRNESLESVSLHASAVNDMKICNHRSYLFRSRVV